MAICFRRKRKGWNGVSHHEHDRIRWRENPLQYAEKEIVIRDASNNAYFVRFGADRRITEIQVLDRIWKYSYEGDTVIESRPDGSSTAITQDVRGLITRIEKREQDGRALLQHGFTYDVDGNWTEGREGNFTFQVGDFLQTSDALSQYTLELDGVKTTSVFGPHGMIRRFYGDDDRKMEVYTHDQTGRQVFYRDANHQLTSIKYDDAGRMVEKSTPGLPTETRTYNPSGKLLSDSNPYSTWKYEYDNLDRLIKEVNPDASVIEYGYENASRLPAWKVDARGNRTDYQYDGRGLQLSVVGPYAPGEREKASRTTYAYDEWGNRVSETNAVGAVTKYEYDLGNRLIAQTDPLGHTTRYVYDGMGRKISETDPLGSKTEWVYDERGLVVEIKGSTVAGGGTGCTSCAKATGTFEQLGKYEYNAARLLTKFTDVLGNVTTHEYDDLGHKVAEVDPMGRVTRFENDLVGNILAQTAPNGGVTRFTYTSGNLIATMTDPLGAVTKYEYDAEGRQTAVILADGATRRTEYDVMGRMTKTIDADGSETSFAYDLAGNLIRQTDSLGVITEYQYDEANRRTALIADVNGKQETTRHAYDAVGRLLSTTNPAGEITRFEYDADDRLTASITPLGHKTTHEYDEAGRRIRTTNPEGNMIQLAYDAGGNVVSMHDGVNETLTRYDALNRVIWTQQSGLAAIENEYDASGNLLRTVQDGAEHRYVYDDAGLLTETINPTGASTKYAYDAAGRVVATTDPLGNVTRHEYNEIGQRVKTILPDEHTLESVYNVNGQLAEARGGPDGIKKYEYDAVGRQLTVTDANGLSKTTEYDSIGRVIQIANELNQPVRYEYDAAGRRTSLTDANGNKTVWTYDTDGRQTSMTFPNGDREEYVYDDANRLIEKKTPSGEFIRYTYDDAGRMTKTDINGWVVNFVRDARGNVLEEKSPNTTMRYTYDTQGRMTSATDTKLNAALHYQYDASGRRTRMAYELADEVNAPSPLRYAYTAQGQLERIWRENADADHPLVTYAYNDNGQRVRMEYANGVVTNYAYHPAGNLQSIIATGPRHDANNAIIPGSAGTGEVLASFEYAIDDTGNRTGLKLANGDTLTYQYDDAYRLTRETRVNNVGATTFDQTFEYDAVGNRVRSLKNGTEITYVYNAANQLTQEVAQVPNAQPITKTYTYDANGNMIQIATQGDPAVAEPNTFTYDAANRLTQWSDGTNTETTAYRGATYHRQSVMRGEVTQSFLHDFDDVVLDLNTDAAFTEYVTPFLDENIFQRDAGGLRYITHDALNSHRLSTATNGIPSSFNDYTAYGEDHSSEGLMVDVHGFAGRERIGVSGLYDNRNRMLSTTASVFFQRDPLLYDANRAGNLYLYAEMNPMNKIDPFGLDCVYAWQTPEDFWCGNHTGFIKWCCEKFIAALTGRAKAARCLTSQQACNINCAVLNADNDVGCVAACQNDCRLQYAACLL